MMQSPDAMPYPPSSNRIFWVGGTSGLARTFIHKYGHQDLILAGIEESAPNWLQKDAEYLRIDLTKKSVVIMLPC